jgi:hypothetical protein
VRRRLLNLVTALSVATFMFCVVTGTIGFRDSSELELEWSFGHRSFTFLSDRGALAVVASTGWPTATWGPDARRRQPPYWVVARVVPLTIHSAVVVEAIEEVTQCTDGTAISVVSFHALRSNVLFVGLFTLALPTLRLVLRLRRKPVAGLCSRCGYDLRATPERCPECGRRSGSRPAVRQA